DGCIVKLSERKGSINVLVAGAIEVRTKARRPVRRVGHKQRLPGKHAVAVVASAELAPKNRRVGREFTDEHRRTALVALHTAHLKAAEDFARDSMIHKFLSRSHRQLIYVA